MKKIQKKKKMTKTKFIETVYDIVLEQYIVPTFINDRKKTRLQYSYEDVITLLNTVVGYKQYNSEWADEILEKEGEENG